MTTRNYGAIRDSKIALALLGKLTEANRPFAYDIEAGYRGPDQEKGALKQFHPEYIVTGISFTDAPTWARYIPLDHDDDGNIDNQVEVARALWRFLNTNKGVAHNKIYELKGMTRWFRKVLWRDPELGEEIRETKGVWRDLADTQLLVWMAADFHPLTVGKDLKNVADAAFGIQMTHFEDLFPYEDSDLGPAIKKGKIRFARFNTRNSYHPKVINYACEDSAVAFMLYEKYKHLLDEKIVQVEEALTEVLYWMEAGVIDEDGVATGNMTFDWSMIERKSIEVEKFRQLMGEEILATVSKRLGRVVNINLNSAPQLAKILFEPAPEGLGLPVKIRSDKTNAPSTSDDALKLIAKSDPVIKKMLQYRQVVKLNTAYLLKFLNELRYSGTDAVFPNHNQMGALTGRMSVDQVSYQQWPKPYHFELDDGTTLDLNFRDLFKAPDEFRIVGFDYANIQMRIAGVLSGETKIIDAFNSGRDLHRATAATTFRIAEEAVTGSQRSAAKALANSERVLTSSGWMRMGDVRVGDRVVVPSGGEAVVGGVYPQGMRDIYSVELSDGSKVRADGEHFWSVVDANNPSAGKVLKTTQEMLDSGLLLGDRNRKGTWRWRIPNVEPLEFRGDSDLPVDPYLLGLLLGDGSLSAPALTLAVGDEDAEETIRRVTSMLPEGVFLKSIGRNSYRLTSATPGAYRNHLDRHLKGLGLRWKKTDGRFGPRSWEKFIPEEYKFGSIRQRYALLRGLMDADGTVGDRGPGTLTTTSKQMAEDVAFIVNSLGGRTKISDPFNNKYSHLGETRVGRDAYRVTVATPEVPFALTRKANRWEEQQARRSRYSPDKKIVAIVPDGREEATCIGVDHPDHEFITSGVTRTHNTLNFAVLFGSGPAMIAESLSTPQEPMTKEDAIDLLEDYFKGYPNLSNWIAHQHASGREEKIVWTFFGRKYTVWDYYAPKEWQRAKGDRMTVNAPIQGTEADILKLAMVRVHRKLKQAGLLEKVRLTLTVHDALEFLVHDSVSTQTVIDLLDPMVNFPIAGFGLEIRADWHEGYQWGAQAEIKLDENKQIKSYEFEYELKWEKKTLEWSGETLHSVLDPYYEWEKGYFGESYKFYERKNPDFRPAEIVPEAVEEEPAPEPEEDSEPTPEPDAAEATVTLVDMPTESRWGKFEEFLQSHPGGSVVKIETPEGNMTLDGTYSIRPEDQPALSLMLGGATLSFWNGEVEADDVFDLDMLGAL